jgi:hypothetical protein
MAGDGYDKLLSRTERFQIFSENQTKVNSRLKEIAKEISELPKIPNSIDDWIESWTDSKKKSFGIDSFNKHLKIKKEYTSLVENADNNLREMKILAIEDLLDKINNTLNK